MKPGKHQRSKQKCQDLCWKVHDQLHNLLFYAHTLCMSYITTMFVLASSLVSSKQLLCFVHGQGHKREQKHTTRTLSGLITVIPLY